MQARDQDDRLEQIRRRLDQLKALAERWGTISHHELQVAHTLQDRATDEMRRAQSLEEQGLLEEAAHARTRQAQLLDDAETLITSAENAVANELTTELEEDHAPGGQIPPIQPRRPPN